MTRRITPTRIGLGLVVLMVLAAVFYSSGRDRSVDESTPTVVEEQAETRPQPDGFKQFPPRRDPAPDRVTDRDEDRVTADEDFEDADAERWKSAHIEEIKSALYELDIDSVAQLHQLDEFVALGDADTRDFWNTSWSGVDDWKRDQDGFELKRMDDGSLVFVPGEQTKRTYSFLESFNAYQYDEASQEFIHETDYYGKPIQNIVKFLRDDVMVFMVVSGRKVDLNIYQLDRKASDR